MDQCDLKILLYKLRNFRFRRYLLGFIYIVRINLWDNNFFILTVIRNFVKLLPYFLQELLFDVFQTIFLKKNNNKIKRNEFINVIIRM